jgi:hypothetical protein
MKHYLLASISVFLLFFSLAYSQEKTDIHLFNLNTTKGNISVTDHQNISNNDGYDNQPSFLTDDKIVFASTRSGQTDIAQYSTNSRSITWINHSEGGEYSPMKIPNQNAVSAVRLDKDGKQRLYTYSLTTGESTALIKDLVVAYYTWYDKNNVVSAVIEGEDLNLYVTQLSDGKSRLYDTKVGRSFHKIPNSNLVSFISKKNKKQWEIKSLDPITGEIKLIAYTIKGVEDICWLNGKTILSGKDSKLYKLTIQRDNNWKTVIDLSDLKIKKMTRLAINQSATKLLIAADADSTKTSFKKPEEIALAKLNQETALKNEANTSRLSAIIQKQLDAYNSKDVDAFMSFYTEDIKLYNYPNELLSEGQNQMRKDYISWFERARDLKATIKKRIVIGNKVIDEEQIIANGEIFNTVVIYEIKNGRIRKVTFMQ